MKATIVLVNAFTPTRFIETKSKNNPIRNPANNPKKRPSAKVIQIVSRISKSGVTPLTDIRKKKESWTTQIVSKAIE